MNPDLGLLSWQSDLAKWIQANNGPIGFSVWLSLEGSPKIPASLDRLNTAIRNRDAHTVLGALLPNADSSKVDCAVHAADARIPDQRSSRSIHPDDSQRSCGECLAFESSIGGLLIFYALSSPRAELLAETRIAQSRAIHCPAAVATS